MSLKEEIKKRMEGHGDKIVTPRVEAFLNECAGNLVVSDEHAERLKELVTDNSNSDRSARFGASSRGTCHRRQVFAFLGMPGLQTFDERLMNIFLDGTWRHLRWQMMGLTAGFFTDVEVHGEAPDLKVRVSADAANVEEGWGFELKGVFSLSKIQEEGIPHRHMLQMHTMMLTMPWFDRWVYVAEDKQTQNWKEIVVKRDEKLIREVKTELGVLNDAISDEVLPPVLGGCRTRTGEEWRDCPYKGRCIEQGRVWPEEPGQWTPVVVKPKRTRLRQR